MAYLIISILLTVLIGLVKILLTLKDIKERAIFAKEYADKYSQFINKKEFDSSSYQWLYQNVDKMQDDLGWIGAINYIPPFENYVMNNYHILLNTLPQIREGNAPSILIHGCQDVLIRHIGMLSEENKTMANKLRNPIKWFFEGLKMIISIPVHLLHWSGLLSHENYQRAYNGTIVKLLSFAVTILFLLSGLMTIILGWDQFIEIIWVILKKLIYN